MTLSKRECFLAAAALRYALANIDDVNDALAESNDFDEPSDIIKMDTYEGSHEIAGTPLEDDEVRELFDRMVVVGSQKGA